MFDIYKSLSEHLADITSTKKTPFFCGEDHMGNKFYINPTENTHSIVDTCYYLVSQSIQDSIEQLGGFVDPRYSIFDDEYIKRIARIISDNVGCGDASYLLVLSVVTENCGG